MAGEQHPPFVHAGKRKLYQHRWFAPAEHSSPRGMVGRSTQQFSGASGSCYVARPFVYDVWRSESAVLPSRACYIKGLAEKNQRKGLGRQIANGPSRVVSAAVCRFGSRRVGTDGALTPMAQIQVDGKRLYRIDRKASTRSSSVRAQVNCAARKRPRVAA